MKLISYVHAGQAAWGAVIDGQVINLARITGLDSLAAFLGSPQFAQRATLVQGQSPVATLAEVTLLPVIPQPEKIICVLRNYHDPNAPATELPAYPPIFLRTWRSQTAHDAPMVRPRVSTSLDWEGELAVIIGQGGRDIAPADAYRHVAGYACYNDGSVRDWQAHAKQIAAGKNFEATGAFGPWMVTADEIEPGRKLALEVRLNGEVVQAGHTHQMIFDIPALIHYASTIVTLAPGDVLVTGTPGGAGFTRKPPRFLQPGDVCEVEIEGVGLLRNLVVQQA